MKEIYNLSEAVNVCHIARQENPNIPPSEMLRMLHITGYSPDVSIYAVCEVLSPSLDQVCKCSIAEYKQPLISPETITKILLKCNFDIADINRSLSEYYPDDINRYAVVLDSVTAINAAFTNSYNFSTEDFSIEAWIKPTLAGGTVMSRKSTDGGLGNGGFLLVVKPSGEIKLATDDGLGFFEVNSEVCSQLFDGNFHHVLGLRLGLELKIFVDFNEVKVTPRTDRFSGLDVDNLLPLTIGHTEQSQEEFNFFRGQIGECRVWDAAKYYSGITDWKITDYLSDGLVGMWGWWTKSGLDYSLVDNSIDVRSCKFEIMPV